MGHLEYVNIEISKVCAQLLVYICVIFHIDYIFTPFPASKGRPSVFYYSCAMT